MKKNAIVLKITNHEKSQSLEFNDRDLAIKAGKAIYEAGDYLITLFIDGKKEVDFKKLYFDSFREKMFNDYQIFSKHQESLNKDSKNLEKDEMIKSLPDLLVFN